MIKRDSQNDDDLALVLRLHLHFEAAITDKLQGIFINPKAFDWNKPEAPNFMTRLRLVSAMALITRESFTFGRELAHLRNQFSHNIGKTLTLEDVKTLNKGRHPMWRKLLATDSAEFDSMITVKELFSSPCSRNFCC